jgi:RNA polymerase sigma factor (sigma-70 family)
LNRENADKKRFIAMLKDNKGILLKVIRAYCKNSSDWKDLEQEIIIQLWKSFSSYNDNFRLSTWLYRISLNVAISHYRKNRKLQNNIGLDDVIFVLPAEEVNEEQNQRRTLLYEFISALDDFNKALIILHLEDHSNKEIAQILGISESNVSTKINRIKNRFKTSIQTSHEQRIA